MIKSLWLSILLCAALASAQTATAYKQQTTSVGGLLDPSKFSVNHMVSFGMSTQSGSSLQSQGMYTTMMKYKLMEPLTMRLDFSLPIYSTLNSAQNLTASNISSTEYFQNMPINASLIWKPTNNVMMKMSVMRNVQTSRDQFLPLGNDLFMNDLFIER